MTGKLNLRHTTSFSEHRSGWRYCMASIMGLHDDEGVLLDDFVERTFSWELEQNTQSAKLPYREPWVGIFHNPPTMPDWYYYQDAPQTLLKSPLMQESLKQCKGLYVLSDYHRAWLSTRVDVPVETLRHTTERPSRQFCYEQYQTNPRKKLLQIGVWLRSLLPFQNLKAGGLQKVWLLVTQAALRNYKMECQRAGLDPIAPRLSDVWAIPWVSNDAYDELLNENVVFVNLIDASANNIVVECLIRNTPLLINPLPAVVEYLGEDYPLYYDSLDEAAIKLGDDKLILQAHQYLAAQEKAPFTGNAMATQIETSAIYSALPTPASNSSYSDKVVTSASRHLNVSFDLMMRHVRESLDDLRGESTQMLKNDEPVENKLGDLFKDEALREHISNWNI